MCPTLAPNAFSEDLGVSCSHFEHPRPEALKHCYLSEQFSFTRKRLQNGEGTIAQVRSLSTKVTYPGGGDDRQRRRMYFSGALTGWYENEYMCIYIYIYVNSICM